MYQKEANRGNVFKLSGNMALGGAMPGSSTGNYKYSGQSSGGYGDFNQDNLDAAKNSLQLLKAKQQAKRAEDMLNSDTRNVYQPYTNSSKNSYSNIKGSDWREPINRESYEKRPEMRRPVQLPEDPYMGSNYANNYGKSNTEHQQRPKNYNDYPPAQPPARAPQRNRNQMPKEKPISELKKEQRLEVQEYDESDLITCSAGCGRKFNPDSIEKHEKVCKKVFQSKRKEFNTQSKRIVEKDQVKLMKKGQAVDNKLAMKKKANQKMPKWKAESEAFRAMVKANNGGQNDQDYRQAQNALKEAAGFIKCPHCGRTFNETAGKRHLPFCQEQSKKNKFKTGRR